MRSSRTQGLILTMMLVCGCTVPVELTRPFLTIIHYNYGDKTTVRSLLRIYHLGRVEFTDNTFSSEFYGTRYAELAPDVHYSIFRSIEDLQFFSRDRGYRSAVDPTKAYVPGVDTGSSAPCNYAIWVYQSKDRHHGIAIYDDSPPDLKAFGDEVIEHIYSLLRGR